LVSDAQSNTVSSVIASRRGSIARLPYALRYTTRPSCPTITTAPGICCCAMASLRIGSRTLRRESSAAWPKAVAADRRTSAGIVEVIFTLAVTLHDAEDNPQAFRARAHPSRNSCSEHHRLLAHRVAAIVQAGQDSNREAASGGARRGNSNFAKQISAKARRSPMPAATIASRGGVAFLRPVNQGMQGPIKHRSPVEWVLP
jgi:hypothetical protein